jgi:hypothetical protein
LWVPIEDEVYRCNQVDATAAVYLNPELFMMIPEEVQNVHIYTAFI